MIYPQSWHRSSINGQYFVFKNPNICYIAMRYPKMSQSENLPVPTEHPSYGADAGPNDKDMADGVVGEIENVPQPHKRDATVSKEKVLKLLKFENGITASGSDTGPTTPTNTSTPEPGTPRPTYDT